MLLQPMMRLVSIFSCSREDMILIVLQPKIPMLAHIRISLFDLEFCREWPKRIARRRSWVMILPYLSSSPLRELSTTCQSFGSGADPTRAMAKLGHPDGEVNLTKGAANTGIIQCVSPSTI